jgi:hypothetical protein
MAECWVCKKEYDTKTAANATIFELHIIRHGLFKLIDLVADLNGILAAEDFVPKKLREPVVRVTPVPEGWQQ